MPKKGISKIKENKSWKQLPISIGPEAPSTFDLIQFEELDDYSVENIPVFDEPDSDEDLINAAIASSSHNVKEAIAAEAANSEKPDKVSEEAAPSGDGEKKKKRRRLRNRKKKPKQAKVEDGTKDMKNEQSNKPSKEKDEESVKSKPDFIKKEDTNESDQESKESDNKACDSKLVISKKQVSITKVVDEKEVDDNNQSVASVEVSQPDTGETYDFNVLNESVKENKKRKTEEDNTAEENAAKKLKVDDDIDENKIIAEMSDWNQYNLPLPILRALLDQGFKTPMPIQEQVLPVAIQQRKDILGAAETGSGKTLAFGIPLICHLMEQKARKFIPTNSEEACDKEAEETAMNDEDFLKQDFEEDFDDNELMVDNNKHTHGLAALILAPTRELAIQVKNHLLKITKYVDVTLAAIVGGMSVQKQQRMLSKKPDIVIATPGRLWELVSAGNERHLSRLQTLRYLVLDEADRMLERGHFEDLKKLLEIINSEDCYQKRQNFLFSATLTTVRDVSTRVKKSAGYKAETRDKKLEQLSKQLVGKRKPHVVDLTTRKMTAEKLKEARILCDNKEKDFYLYYFLKSNPGRTLVFVNSIDSIFRLNGVFEALKCSPLHLHAKMQQRQRLKHLDRFQENQNAVMIASDVAARGLDIPDVKHVIHYQVPRTLEVFVHRSGRSARSGKDGLSLMFVSPEESNSYKKICRLSNKPEGLPFFPINNGVMNEVKNRVRLARELDIMVHRQKKIRVKNDWFTKMAEEADMDVDDDLITEDKGAKEKQHVIKMKRQQLDQLLKRPVFPKGFSGNFITKTGTLQRPDYQFAH